MATIHNPGITDNGQADPEQKAADLAYAHHMTTANRPTSVISSLQIQRMLADAHMDKHKQYHTC